MTDTTLPLPQALAAFSAAWAGFGVASGWVATRIPARRLERPGPLTRLRPWERSGRVYVGGLGIRRWKDRLPEQGDFFAGGMSKRSLPGTAAPHLRRFAAETRRAELVHWAQVAFGFTFFLWNPVAVGVVMVVFALVVHLPFIAVQRYNRLRVERVLERRRRPPVTVDSPVRLGHDGGDAEEVAMPSDDDQREAELLDEEALGEEELQTDGLRAHDLDLVDSVRDRAGREVPDFDRRRPRRDHTASQLVAPRNGTEPVPDVLGTELPAEGPGGPEESAMHLEDEQGHPV